MSHISINLPYPRVHSGENRLTTLEVICGHFADYLFYLKSQVTYHCGMPSTGSTTPGSSHKGENRRQEMMSVPIFLLALLGVGSISADFTLTVLHTNDFATRVEQINKYGTKCDPSRQACYGGSARLATLVKDVKAGYDNVLVLDGGDVLEGVVWAGLEGGAAMPTLMAMVGYDAIVSI